MWFVTGACGLALAMASAVPVMTAANVPLADAVRFADHDAVERLLRGTIDVDAATADGMTALHWAVQRDSVALTERLIAAGANVRARNRYGVPPLTLAVTNGNAAIVARLITAGADPNTQLDGGETVLMTAARTGEVEVILRLLAAGAEPNAREESRGQTALMWAAAENNADAIIALVAGGADVGARTGDQTTADAAGTFSREVGLAEGAQTGPSFTALLFSAQLGQLEAAQALVDVGGDVNDSFPDGTSALVVAAMNGQFELGAFLIAQGADIHASRQGWNALHQTIRLRRTNIGHLPPPEGQGVVSSMDFIEKILASGIDVNAPMTADFRDGYRNRLNRIGATPFLLASKNVDTTVMRVLLEAGADPLVPNADLTTPLMVAAGVDMWNPGEDGGATVEDEPEALEAVKMLVEFKDAVTEGPCGVKRSVTIFKASVADRYQRFVLWHDFTVQPDYPII